MRVEIAKNSGFCFGVERSIKMVNELLAQDIRVAMLGPIIHNPIIVGELKRRGAHVLQRVEDATNCDVIVVRAHGVSAEIYKKINSLGIKCVDATCPFVRKIHEIVQEHTHESSLTLLAGNRLHPEIAGIIGHCKGTAHTFGTVDELDFLLKSTGNLNKIDIVVASQTTFDVDKWKKCLLLLKKTCTHAKIFDTICSATSIRQKNTAELARRADVMLVIGGRSSSNTTKLAEICEKFCKTFHVETYEEICAKMLKTANLVGITAGASTPENMILEVSRKVYDILRTNPDNEPSFAELLEESLKQTSTDSRVRGTVARVTQNEVFVEIGRKQAGILPISELLNEKNQRIDEILKPGDELDLLIIKTNDQDGTITLSQRKLAMQKGWDEVLKAHETGDVLSGRVVKIIKGGMLVSHDGYNIFVPASQATDRRGEPLEPLVGKTVNFRVIEVNKPRRRAVGSVRAVLEESRKKLAEKFWASLEIGQSFEGIVKSFAPYGAFISLGPIDGMVHISELSWGNLKHPSDVLAIGDTIRVYLKDFDREKERISLTYKRAEDNPWQTLFANFPKNQTVKAKIVALTNFGAFAELLPGIDGLIHISEISDDHVKHPRDVLKVGDEVTVLVKNVDFENKRISLSMKSLQEPETTL